MKSLWHNRTLVLLVMLFQVVTCTLLSKTFDSNNPPNLLKDFKVLKSKLDSNPNDVSTLNSLGILYAKSGKLDDAIRIWQHALNLNPRYVHLYNNLGSALKEKGKKDQAKLIFQLGLTISPSYWIYYNLGLLEKEDGNYGKAADNFKNCLRYYPTFQPAMRKLEEMGYQKPLPRLLPRMQSINLGNYKQPVGFGNIEMQTLYPNGYQNNGRAFKQPSQKWKKKTIPRQKTPLSLASCTQIIASFKALPKDKYIALTFDDGPHPTHTPRILDILKQERIHATFFVLGSRSETYPDIVTRASNEGNEIGNHSWNHKSLAKQSQTNALNGLRKTNELINALTQKPCNFVRPPYGHTNSTVKKMLNKHGWYQAMWDSDSRDWENKNPNNILWKVMSSVRPGCIILFHDIHPGAAKMLPTLIKAFKANNYKFVTMSEMVQIANSQS